MLHLRESGVLGMWNDAVFPPPLSSSSSLTSSSFNGDAAEIITWLQSSHASVELEKLNCSNNLFGTLQENYCSTGFLQRQFCSSPSVESNPGLVITGNGDPTTAEVEPAAVGGRSRKRGLIGRDAVDTRHQAPSRHSKRLKTTTTTTTSASSSPPKHQHHLPRNESAPSMAGMPLAKVPARRSQKLGDKITALQQLVSPFGKTDTASVLHEAALSIKFLHDQIRMLAAPYFGMRSPEEHLRGHVEVNGDLRRRGLCLVPKHTIIGLMDQAACGTCLPDTAERKTDINFY